MLSEQELAELRRQERWSSALAFPICSIVLWAIKHYYRYRYVDLEDFQRKIWKQLDEHDGPVIWAANHLTLIDSFLIFFAVFPLSRLGPKARVPWSTPEYRNYYYLGGPVQQRLIRWLMYMCRCIPFLREGEDAVAVRWRETAYDKLVWILKRDGAVFVYPEAGRARNGWFEPNRPKDFLGRLVLDVPKAKFLCVYLRGERQQYTTTMPHKGDRLRMHAALVDGVMPGETTARQISQRLFNTIAELQTAWWKDSALPKNCGGNDVVDLKSPLLRENIDSESGEADEEWLARHLTAKERAYWQAQSVEKRFVTFWKFFAAKEACFKALSHAGIASSNDSFPIFEADLFRRKLVHLPTGCQVEFSFTDEDEDKLHCIAVLRGGFIGDDNKPGDVLWKVEQLAPGDNPSVEARERCLRFIAESSDDIPGPSALAFGSESGAPKLLRGGRWMDWGVSLSHSGRFAAFSFIVS